MAKQRREEGLRKSFGRRVRSLRRTRELSQMALAERSGLDHNYIGQVERGQRNASIESAAMIADGLQIDLADLMQLVSRSRRREISPDLMEILALLEGETADTVARARDLIQLMLSWERAE